MLLFVAILAGIATAYLLVQTVRPLTEGAITAEEWQRVEDESLDLLHRRDRLVEELRDLEFEAALDKIGGKDLANIRARFEREALEIDRALENRVDDYRDRIDAAVQARLSGQGDAAEPVEAPAPATKAEPAQVEAEPVEAQAATHACVACDTALPEGARFCDACGAPQQATCGACGAENRPEARFCKGCGASMSEAKS